MKYKVTEWVTVSLPKVYIVDANSQAEAKENYYKEPAREDYDNIYYGGEIETVKVEETA
jgi:hypothetical protein